MMFLKNKITKLGDKFTQKHDLSDASTVSEEDMLKKLRQYQKRTYLNQELSRRRSIERFYGQNLPTAGEHDDETARERSDSAPHSPLLRVESDFLPRKRVQRTNSTQSDDYIACGVHNKQQRNLLHRFKRQVTFQQQSSRVAVDSDDDGVSVDDKEKTKSLEK